MKIIISGGGSVPNQEPTMHAPNLARNSQPLSRPRLGEAAFTITELLVTAGVLLIVGATAMFTLTMMNEFASSSRVLAAAQAVVQNQVDQVLARGPYVPTNSPPDVPTILTSGTTTTSNLPVLLDPDTGIPLVSGTLATTVSDSSGSGFNGGPNPNTAPSMTSTTPLYILQVSVKLTYTFRGKPFTVVMNTMRAPDK
jgi:type II secretory pathway pseudopilin PulG